MRAANNAADNGANKYIGKAPQVAHALIEKQKQKRKKKCKQHIPVALKSVLNVLIGAKVLAKTLM
jgi:hypothetical protein